MRRPIITGSLLAMAITLPAHAGPNESATLAPSGGAAHDRVGHAVAIDADILCVGARNSGRASVYRRVGSTWVRESDLRPQGAQGADLFGSAVDVDGNVCVVGAPWRSGANGSVGAAWIYRRGTSGWSREAGVTASDGVDGDQFGASVAVTQDIVAVGAPTAIAPGGLTMGVVYVFERSGSDWNQVQILTPPPGEAPAMFGRSLAADGTAILVGTAGDGDTPSGAYVFRRGADAWAHEATLTCQSRAVADSFGLGVDLADGVAIVGACTHPGAGDETGAAFVFEYIGGLWVERTMLIPTDPMPGDDFGQSVATDGQRIVVGAPSDDNRRTDAGSAYVFGRDASAPGGWVQLAKVAASDGAADDRLGRSVGVSPSIIAVGAPLHDTSAGPNAGLVYLYRSVGGCPLDWDRDGCVNDQDFFAFANDYFNAAGPRGHADFNDDGVVTETDWVEFVTALMNPDGC